MRVCVCVRECACPCSGCIKRQCATRHGVMLRVSQCSLAYGNYSSELTCQCCNNTRDYSLFGKYRTGCCWMPIKTLPYLQLCWHCSSALLMWLDAAVLEQNSQCQSWLMNCCLQMNKTNTSCCLLLMLKLDKSKQQAKLPNCVCST